MSAAGYGKKHAIRYKSAVDLVTDTDHRSEDFLIDSIRRNFPDHSIITEESGDLAGLSSHRWFIDPLDRTINSRTACHCLRSRWPMQWMERSAGV